jgi:inosine/xanthosine triphosphatase
LIVHVASLRPAKVEGAREALAAIATIDARFRDVEIRPIDVGDVAPRMPMSRDDVIDGARERVAALVNRLRGEGAGEWYAVGVEGGLDPIGRVGYSLQSWACVTDGQRYSYGAGPALILPDSVAREVVAGAELGDVVDRLAAAPVRGTRGAWGVLTNGLVDRRDAFRLAVVSAFAPFYNGKMY